MKAEQQRVHNVLLDTITLLCKNSLRFSQSLRIEGVIGITTDGSDVFLVHVNETIATNNSSSAPGQVKQEVVDGDQSSYNTPPLKRVATASLSSAGDQSASKQHLSTASSAANFSCGRAVSKPFANSVPVVRGIRSTKTTFGSEGSTAISSTVVTESFVMGTGDVPYVTETESLHPDQQADLEYGQHDYQAVDESGQMMWSGEEQEHKFSQQMFQTAPKSAPRIKRPKQQSSRGGTGVRGGSACRGRGGMSRSGASAGVGHQQSPRGGSNQFVITESTHMCGYPGCGKRFRFKHDLLRHQTKVHGREPVRQNSRGKGSGDAGMMDDADYYAAGSSEYNDIDQYADSFNN